MIQEAKATVLLNKTGEPALATSTSGGRARGPNATRVKVVVKRPLALEGGGGGGGGGGGVINMGVGAGGDDDDGDGEHKHKQQQQQQQHPLQAIISSSSSSSSRDMHTQPSSSISSAVKPSSSIPRVNTASTTSSAVKASSTIPASTISKQQHDIIKSQHGVNDIKTPQCTTSEHAKHLHANVAGSLPTVKEEHTVNEHVESHNISHVGAIDLPVVHDRKGKQRQRDDEVDVHHGAADKELNTRQQSPHANGQKSQQHTVEHRQDGNDIKSPPAISDVKAPRLNNGLFALAQPVNGQNGAQDMGDGVATAGKAQHGSPSTKQQTNGERATPQQTTNGQVEAQATFTSKQTVNGQAAVTAAKTSKQADDEHSGGIVTPVNGKHTSKLVAEPSASDKQTSVTVTESSPAPASGISSNGLFYTAPPPETSASGTDTGTPKSKKQKHAARSSSRSSSAHEELPADKTSTPTKRPVSPVADHPLFASSSNTGPPTPGTGTATPTSASPVAPLNDSIDDLANGAQVLTNEQLWALKLPAGTRQVLDLILNNLSFVRPDSPAYESAAVIKSLVLVALGFGMPITKLAAASQGQDWRECVLTLSDLKITKVAKEDDEIEDDVVASARPFDGVVVEIDTTKVSGATAKKWILKSQPDLVHTTLTPNSMVPLPEVLIEPYNPIATFLETLAWRGLVVDEATGKLYRPSPAMPDRSLNFVKNESGVEITTPLEPVFHATSRSSIGIFSPGVTPHNSFNPLSSPFARVREPPKAATGIWAATTQPMLKKRVVERIRNITQGACSARLVDDLLGHRGKVQEAEGEWTGDSGESEEEGGLSALRGSLSEAAQFANEVKNNKKGKRKGNGSGSGTPNGNGNSSAKKGKSRANGGNGGYYPPPPPPAWGYRGGGRQPQWGPPPGRYPPYPGRVPPHLLYGYGHNNNRFAQPGPYGMMPPPYPPYGNGGWPGYPPAPGRRGGGGGGGWPAYGNGRGGYYAPQPYPPMQYPVAPPSPPRGAPQHASVSAAADVSSNDVPQLVCLDDDDEGSSSVGSPTQQATKAIPTGPKAQATNTRNTPLTITYGLGGEHWIRRNPGRVRALLVWTPNTFLADALAYRVWSPMELLGFAVELYTAAMGIENVLSGDRVEKQLARLFMELQRREAEARGEARLVELEDDEGEFDIDDEFRAAID